MRSKTNKNKLNKNKLQKGGTNINVQALTYNLSWASQKYDAASSYRRGFC